MCSNRATVVMCLLCTTISTAWASDYTIVDLGTLGGTLSSAQGINDNGAVVGWSETVVGSDTQHAFLWDPQTLTMRDLGTLGGTSSEAVAINNAGQIAGWSNTASGEGHAFLWDPQTAAMRDLGTLGGDKWSSAYDINDDGSVVGQSNADRNYWPLCSAFLWDSQTELMRDLGCLGYPDAYRIAALNWWSGQVVASLSVRNSDTFPNVAWDPLSETTRLINESSVLISEINDLGVAAARGWASGALNLNTGTFSVFLLGPVGSHSYAGGINRSGTVVGNAETTTDFCRNTFCQKVFHAYAAIPPFVAAGGFSGPLEGPPYVNSVKAGAAVPVKWQLADGNGGYVCDVAQVTSITTGEIPCEVYGAAPENVVAVEPTGGSGLRCDGDTFVFTWKTSRTWAGKCFALLLNLSDGTTQDAWFAVK